MATMDVCTFMCTTINNKHRFVSRIANNQEHINKLQTKNGKCLNTNKKPTYRTANINKESICIASTIVRKSTGIVLDSKHM